MSAMVKRTAALDSAHQIGPSTLLKDDLMVAGGSSSVVEKKGVIGKIGDVIGDSSITSHRNGKRIPAFDSPRKISLNAAMEQRPTRG